ncbi:AGE family epimerase/isomerase [Victivallis sp. Marseille-Q1083]|uniref:AGE family epimerase/isomerase n=1 Tax=Victivallis sp. Marseille-Q1083 TaxID=2717288 RepID=UPI00158DCF8A|nr:AGE family epimerase/isomerase [Victivallis sp. Marseille-Q1083]
MSETNGPCVLEDLRQCYEQELLEEITPFWLQHSVDREFGGFLTMLDGDGKPFGFDKYMWLQWRNIYMFARLAASPFGCPAYLAAAVQGYEFVERHGRQPDGALALALSREGAIRIPAADERALFSESFAALGAAALYRATGEAKYEREARRCLEYFADSIRRFESGNYYGLPAGRRFGHKLIMINTACTVSGYLDTNDYIGLAGEAVEECFAFYSPQCGRFFERANPDGSFDWETPEGRLVNPGHGLEAMWFVMQYAERIGDQALLRRALNFCDIIWQYAWDFKHGGVFYVADALQLPCPEPTAGVKAWWAQCEALVAAFYCWHLTGEEEWSERFWAVDRWIWRHLRDEKRGGEWFALTELDGTVCQDVKGGAWKGFFHVPRCLLTVLELLQKP